KDWLDNEKIWSSLKSSETEAGLRVDYRCNLDFLRYFESEWLLKHPGWNEGFLSDGPSTNNGLESINSTIKKNHSFRKRLPLHQFLSLAKDIIKHWSKRRDPLSVNCFHFNQQLILNSLPRHMTGLNIRKNQFQEMKTI
ncbi:hypothetical protein BpHYR1_033112, partial [Brachionus plicatilis]